MPRLDSRLSQPFPGLQATPIARLPYQHNVLLRTYLLQRPNGNILIYNSPGILDAAADIQALGNPALLLLNHAHEAMYGQPNIDVPIWSHRDDSTEIGRALHLAGQFESRHFLDEDLEVIPTPGHTPGTTSYLWHNGEHRFLFTGDFIWVEHGAWKAVVLDPALRPDYLESLALVQELDFDVLVPWGVTDDGPAVSYVRDRKERVARVQAIIDRVSADGAH